MAPNTDAMTDASSRLHRQAHAETLDAYVSNIPTGSLPDYDVFTVAIDMATDSVTAAVSEDEL